MSTSRAAEKKPAHTSSAERSREIPEAPNPTTAESQDHSRESHDHSILYQNIGQYKELACFDRFAPELAKLLHDDIEEILSCQSNIHQQLEAARGDKRSDNNVLGCPRIYVKLRHEDIHEEWERYEAALERYGGHLLMSQQIMNLPSQDSLYTDYLAKFSPPIFREGPDGLIFGPTSQRAEHYLSDACAWKGLPQDDLLTTLFIKVSVWINQNIRSRLRRFRHDRARTKPSDTENLSNSEGLDTTDLDYYTILAYLDVLMCIFASCFLTGTMFAIAHIKPLNAQIGSVGVAGTIFTFSIWIMAGRNVRRIEVYAATAAFFAVASVYVSNNDGGDRRH
ncbi:hypothetical protein CC80DRAFT_573618 [Byssothecium circinans]|uniref:DUF6594 domain-containing protein n=1 Tax=Byssothecium circinans TaxID=147558 RepID=A0A6A5THV4_9PLEO|nr:hypothetical protein CC80DRAFT_573618 [Byssothecium circinans]